MTLTGIYTYPIKSLGGISLQASDITPQGLRYDRRWMIVEPDGSFITQRQYPKMAWLQPEINGEHLIIRHKDASISPLKISLYATTGKRMEVQIWKDRCEAELVSEEADKWFNTVLEMDGRLVYMPDTTRRLVDPEYRIQEDIVSFADGYPFLIIGEASLALLNSKLESPIPMSRFRPNFVFSSGNAHIEDTWKHLQIGSARFYAVKPCARCQIPTIDAETARFHKEPTKTLATYRKQGKNVLFGMNLLPDGSGEVKLGDILSITQ